MDTKNFEEYVDLLTHMVVEYAPNVLVAIVILIVGIKIISKVVNLAVNSMISKGIGEDITPFLGGLVSVSLKILLFFTVASILGVDVASFVAVLAAASFAVGLALQGSLSNFAAGILVVVFRPYRIGDWIQVSGEFFGQVEEIQIFNTIMVTPGKKTLIVPNGEVINGVVTNFSRKGHIRLELTLLMAYEESFPHLKQVIEEALLATPYIQHDPAPEIGIESYDTHNIVVAVRPYVSPDNYWEATFAVNEAIKSAMSLHGIRMAYSEGVELGEIGQ